MSGPQQSIVIGTDAWSNGSTMFSDLFLPVMGFFAGRFVSPSRAGRFGARAREYASRRFLSDMVGCRQDQVGCRRD
jgi:hypothetical protein